VITRYVTAHLTVIGFSVVLVVVVVWLVVLSLALAEQRRRHDRLVARVSGLSKSVGAIQRRRHNTGTQSAVDTAGQTRLQSTRPPPPFPVPPPSTNPMTSTGRHSLDRDARLKDGRDDDPLRREWKTPPL
jgi:hypothetical protein